jgi:hypothetical protein
MMGYSNVAIVWNAVFDPFSPWLIHFDPGDPSVILDVSDIAYYSVTGPA